MSTFKDKLKMFQESAKNNEKKESTQPKKLIPKKVNTIKPQEKKEVDKSNTSDKSNIPKKDRKQIIYEKSLNNIINKDNANKMIYLYPLNATSTNPKSCKILLFIGDNQDKYINILINMYSNINYKDNYRYTINTDNLNGELKSYKIASVTDGKDIFIISFPSFSRVEEIFNNGMMKKYIDLLNKYSITSINYLFITIDQIKLLNKIELIFFIYFSGFPLNEMLKDRIIILFSSNKENIQENNNNIINDIFVDTNDYFLSEKSLSFDFNSLFTPEYFYINDKIIYEKNDNPEEEEQWNNLNDIIKKIQGKISISDAQGFNINKIYLTKALSAKSSTNDILNILNKIKDKNEYIILLNYFKYVQAESDISSIIITLFNKMYNFQISKKMTKITFKELNFLNNYLELFSKIKFNGLQEITFEKCDIEDRVINSIQNIFTSQLIYLNLSENKLTKSLMFDMEKIYDNLEELYLNDNNIEEINSLMIGKFPNLKKLNLSHNKISDIKCMDNVLNFNNLENLDLSYNNIRVLNRINIPSLKFINITNNPISEGINNFLDLSYNADELILKKNNNELNFNYLKFELERGKQIVLIEFKYMIENNDINDILKNIKFLGINKLKLEGFENFDFLANDTLNMLTELDLRNNTINDISFFECVKFKNLKELLFQENIEILKGFDSLKIFDDICFEKIYINLKDNKYNCQVIYNNDYKISFTFDELDFLKYEFFTKFNYIELEQLIWDKNINFFFEAIQNINSYPLFKIKPMKLDIKYEEDKYKVYCDENEYYSNLKMYFFVNDLNIFNIEFFNEIKEIKFSGVIFDENINLSITTMPNLEKISLINNNIKSVKILSIINEMKKMKEDIIIDSNDSNECNNNLLEYFDEKVSILNISRQNCNDCLINYSLPFNFYLTINKKELNKIKTVKSCEKIILNNMELIDEDINFIRKDELLKLKELNLDENKITNAEFLDKIKSSDINFISIKNNLINECLKFIDENIKSEKLYNLEIKRKNENENIIMLSLIYKGNYTLYLDMFYDLDKTFEILTKINLGNISSLNLSGLNLKSIDFLSNKSFIKIETLILDNNQIEDISIFSEIYLPNLKELSIIKNPIRKGLQALKSFSRIRHYFNISVTKEENEYKIYTEVEDPKSKIEFYISDIEEIKNIYDFDSCVINLNKVDIKDNKNEENVQELKDKIKNLIDKLQENKKNFIIGCRSSISKTDDPHEPYDDFKPHIIIDNGSGYIKAGLSGEEWSRTVFPTCIGYPKYSSGMVGGDKKEFFVGADAEAKRGVLKLNYPIENGIVNNWDDMEKIWGHIFTNELRVAPEEHNVMITEPILNPKENGEKMAQIIFETFNVPGFYIMKQTVASLYSAGKFTGLSVDSGECITQIAPIFEGFNLTHACIKLDIGGRDLTNYYMKLLEETGYRFSTNSEKEIVKAIKEKSCYVALDCEEELKYVEPFDYELPDGCHCIIKDQRIRCPEALFKPQMIRKDTIGISQACYDSIQKCDIDTKRHMYNCIILSGGNTMFNGLPERFTKDIKCLVPESMKEEVKIIASPERKFEVWNGCSIISSTSEFESSWITKTEYEESGATIVHRKCF